MQMSGRIIQEPLSFTNCSACSSVYFETPVIRVSSKCYHANLWMMVIIIVIIIVHHPNLTVSQYNNIDPTEIFSFLIGAESKCPQEVTILAWNHLY